MVDTPRTQSYLTGTAFADGQSAGSITPQDMRDFIVSTVPWDDPANASTLGTPAILRGTVYGHLAAGVTLGAQSGNTPRTATFNGLQAALNYAVANGKFFELIPGLYEIYGAGGLIFPPGGNIGTYNLVCRGGGQSTVISQFYTTGQGAPVAVFGDPTNGTEMAGADIRGFCFRQGATVTGLTSAVGAVIGQVLYSNISDIYIDGTGANPPYDAIQMNGQAFSNIFDNWTILGWQRHGLFINGTNSTGNHHDNWYFAVAGLSSPGTQTAISGSYVFINVPVSDMLFSRLNCEWGGTNSVIRAGDNGECFGLLLQAFHCEGVELTGSDPSIFRLASTSLQVSSMDLGSCIILASKFTGTPALVHDWFGGNSTVTIQNLNFIQNAGAGYQDSTFYMVNTASADDSMGVVSIDKIRVGDTYTQVVGRLALDPHLAPTANVLVNKVGTYELGVAGSIIKKAVLQVNGAYTHYGQHEDATIIVPASISSFQITLSNLMGATGTQNVRTGNTVHVRRHSGSGSGTLTIKDDAATTLGTPGTTAGVDFWFLFTGTHYVVFTPVT